MDSATCAGGLWFVGSALVTVRLFFLAMSEMLPGDPVGHALGGGSIALLQFVLATLVVAVDLEVDGNVEVDLTL